MTGEGSIYKPTHLGWYVYQIAQRICDCYLADKLNQVWFISTHSYPEKDPQTRIRIAIEKLHPIVDYSWSYPSMNSFRVYETFPVLSWHGHQKTFLNLVRFCLKLWKATGDIKFYPQGRTFTQRAHDGLEEGWLSFAQACGDTTYAWNPEIEYNHQYDKLFATRVHDFDEHRDWEMLEKVISETLAKLEFKREADHGSLLAKTRPSEEV